MEKNDLLFFYPKLNRQDGDNYLFTGQMANFDSLPDELLEIIFASISNFIDHASICSVSARFKRIAMRRRDIYIDLHVIRCMLKGGDYSRRLESFLGSVRKFVAPKTFAFSWSPFLEEDRDLYFRFNTVCGIDQIKWPAVSRSPYSDTVVDTVDYDIPLIEEAMTLPYIKVVCFIGWSEHNLPEPGTLYRTALKSGISPTRIDVDDESGIAIFYDARTRRTLTFTFDPSSYSGVQMNFPIYRELWHL
jgi:hypothetical protein